MPQEEMTIRIELKSTREVEEALSDIEEYFACEGGWWTEPCGTVDHIVTEVLVDEVTYFSLTRDEFLEALGLEAEWVLECYEV